MMTSSKKATSIHGLLKVQVAVEQIALCKRSREAYRQQLQCSGMTEEPSNL